VREIEQSLEGRCFIESVRRAGGGEAVEAERAVRLQEGDVVLVAGAMRGLLGAPGVIGPEVDAEGVRAIGEELDVVITRREIVGKTIADLATEAARGVFLRRIIRGGTEMPLSWDFRLERGDTLTLVGRPGNLARIGGMLGSVERPSDKTDLLYCGVGIVLGTLLGLLSVRVAGVPVTLGAGGGVLVAGLVFGWLRSLHPTFGSFPGPVQAVFSDLGLNAFIAVVGLAAGPSAWAALRETGVGLLVAGVFATMAPPFVGLYLGRLMRIEPVVLIGAICGARSANAAIGAVTDAAESSAPAVGFTVPYAIANVLLTVWGPVIVGIVH
jgi:putative transport protein